MADYTIVNLLALEDTVSERLPGLEGRFGRKHLGSRDLGVSHWRFAPGLRNPTAHSHREQEEVYVVVSGSGRVRLDDEVRDIAQWDVVRVAPRVVRAFEAGPDGLELLAVGGRSPRAATACGPRRRGPTRAERRSRTSSSTVSRGLQT